MQLTQQKLSISKISKKPSQVDEKSSKNRSWPVLGVQGRLGDASGRVRDAPGTRQSRPRSDLGTPRACQERPGDAQERSRDGLKTVPGACGAMSERVRREKHRRVRHRNDFSLFLSCRAKAPMCCSYQFLQCFVGFERCKQRTRTRSENARKSRRFGLQNRARERPGDPKSSPGGPVRATKREKVARSSSMFLEACANGPTKRARASFLADKSAPPTEATQCWYGKNVRDDDTIS